MARKLNAYNLYMKRELKKRIKPGMTKAQRKAAFKAAAKGWKKRGKASKSTRPRTRVVAKPKRRIRTMARKKRPRRRGFLNMQTIGGLIEKVALAAPAISVALEPIQPMDKLRKGVMYYTGFNWADKSFDLTRAAVGWGPFVLVKFIRKGISFVNKILSGL